MDDRKGQAKKFVEEWAVAEQRGDAAFLEGTLTDDFVGVGPLGFMLNKQQWLGRFAGGSPTSPSPSKGWMCASTGRRRSPRAGKSRPAGSRATTWEGSSARPLCWWSGTAAGCWQDGMRAPSQARLLSWTADARRRSAVATR
jgi:hypothetical protein